MAKESTKRTRLVGILDNTSYGFTFGQSQMTVSQKCEKHIRKMLAKCPYAQSVEGSDSSGNAVYQILIPHADKTKDPYMLARYEFKKQGGNRFINVTANPTKLATGENDLPVLVSGCEGMYVARGKVKPAQATFMYLNRLPYILLELLPSAYPFTWTGAERLSLENGNINISRYQMAWSSGNLGNQRDAVLWYLRACYGGAVGSFQDKRYGNLGVGLETSVKLHDNHRFNLTVEKKYDNASKLFSVTMYCKDEDPNWETKTTAHRHEQLIRYDCTFSAQFLSNNKIYKISDLEDVYEDKCLNNGGWDIGFVRWLKEKVYDSLKLSYVLNLDSETYQEMLSAAENVTGKSERKLMAYWLDMRNTLVGKSYAEIAVAVDIPVSNVGKNIASILEQTGIDVHIPRSYHVEMLQQRIYSHATVDEKEAMILRARGNQRINADELIERDILALSKVREALNTKAGISTRKFAPIKVHVENLWVKKLLAQHEAKKEEVS